MMYNMSMLRYWFSNERLFLPLLFCKSVYFNLSPQGNEKNKILPRDLRLSNFEDEDEDLIIAGCEDIEFPSFD